MAPPRLERSVPPRLLPSPAKPLPEDAVAAAVSPTGTSPPVGVAAGRATPGPHRCQPHKDGVGVGGEMQEAASFWWENSFFQRRGAAKEAQPHWEEQPRGKALALLRVSHPWGEVWGPKPSWELRHAASPAALPKPELSLRWVPSWPHRRSPSCSPIAPGGTRARLSLSPLQLALEQPRGWGRWDGRIPAGAGSSWCGCPAAFLQHGPLRRWMCSIISKTQRQARIQLGPRPPGRARLSLEPKCHPSAFFHGNKFVQVEFHFS